MDLDPTIPQITTMNQPSPSLYSSNGTPRRRNGEAEVLSQTTSTGGSQITRTIVSPPRTTMNSGGIPKWTEKTDEWGRQAKPKKKSLPIGSPGSGKNGHGLGESDHGSGPSDDDDRPSDNGQTSNGQTGNCPSDNGATDNGTADKGPLNNNGPTGKGPDNNGLTGNGPHNNGPIRNGPDNNGPTGNGQINKGPLNNVPNATPASRDSHLARTSAVSAGLMDEEYVAKVPFDTGSMSRDSSPGRLVMDLDEDVDVLTVDFTNTSNAGNENLDLAGSAVGSPGPKGDGWRSVELASPAGYGNRFSAALYDSPGRLLMALAEGVPSTSGTPSPVEKGRGRPKKRQKATKLGNRKGNRPPTREKSSSPLRSTKRARILRSSSGSPDSDSGIGSANDTLGFSPDITAPRRTPARPQGNLSTDASRGGRANGRSSGGRLSSTPLCTSTTTTGTGRGRGRIWCLCRDLYNDRQMIKCDNHECPLQWFHYPCVGLLENTVIDTTTGWVCPWCRHGDRVTNIKKSDMDLAQIKIAFKNWEFKHAARTNGKELVLLYNNVQLKYEISAKSSLI